MTAVERTIFSQLEKVFENKKGYIRVYDNLDLNIQIRAFQIFLGYKEIGSSICMYGAHVPLDSIKIMNSGDVFFTYKPFERFFRDIVINYDNYVLSYGSENYLTEKTNILTYIEDN